MISLSALPHTWLIDIDGTILRHNGNKIDQEEILPGVKNFWSSIPNKDSIILLTARSSDYRDKTINLFNNFGLRFNHIIFDLPVGERILINDIKPMGLLTAISINIERDVGLKNLNLSFQENL